MIPAYDEDYLPDFREKLGTLFDLGYYQKGIDIDEIAERFASSVIAEGVETGSPKYLAGMSGTEMAMDLFNEEHFERLPVQRTDAYWTGYALAHIQWYYNRPFREIIDKCPCSRLLGAYPALHEVDIDKTVDIVRKFIIPDNILKIRRKMLGLTQKQLASLAGISLSTLRAYEQGTTSLENASGKTLYMLGRYLGLTVEELLLG